MEIWSDGTIEPSGAIAEAAQILVQHAQLIAGFNRQPGPETRQAAAGVYVTPEAEAKSLADLGLSPRVLNALHGRKITKVGQVLAMDEKDLLAIRNFGQKSLDELREKLIAHGFLAEAPQASSDEAGANGDLDDALTGLDPLTSTQEESTT
jgi:DNA-directed RNA polymerase subunit alpha